ncbi:hypothetical protein YC2023_038246 [Brassica napus]
MKRTQFKINKINKKDHNHLEAHLGDSEPGRPSLNSVVLNFRSSTFGSGEMCIGRKKVYEEHKLSYCVNKNLKLPYGVIVSFSNHNYN